MRTVPENRVTFPCQTCGKSISLPVHRCGHIAECPYCYSYVDVPDAPERALLADSADAVPIAVSGSAEAEEPKGPAPDSRTTSQLWIEVLAVLCLAYLPYLFFALAEFVAPNPTRHSLTSRELYLIMTAFQISSPLLVIMALGRDPWTVFGIVRPKWILDALGGCLICGVGLVASGCAMSLLPSSIVAQSTSSHAVPRPEGIPEYFLLVVGCAAVAFAEELVMRAYLIARLERLLRSTRVAVLATTTMFASYHIYQGLAGAVGIAATGFVYAVSFCLFRRLWPVCVAHAIHSFVASL